MLPIVIFHAALAADAAAQENMSQFAALFDWTMWPLWLSSVMLVALIAERRKKLQDSNVYDPAILETACSLLSEGKVAEAEQKVRSSPAIISQAWAQGLHEYQLGGVVLGEALTTASTLALKPLKRNLGGIATIATVAPLFGLLGTILGMIITFGQINADGGADKAALAGGISVALFTTAAGMIIAIPAIIANRWFSAKLTSYVEIVEAAINRAQYRLNHHQSRTTASATTAAPVAQETVA